MTRPPAGGLVDCASAGIAGAVIPPTAMDGGSAGNAGADFRPTAATPAAARLPAAPAPPAAPRPAPLHVQSHAAAPAPRYRQVRGRSARLAATGIRLRPATRPRSTARPPTPAA